MKRGSGIKDRTSSVKESKLIFLSVIKTSQILSVSGDSICILKSSKKRKFGQITPGHQIWGMEEGEKKLSDTSFSNSKQKSDFFDDPICFFWFRESLGSTWACPLSVRGFKVSTLSRNSPLNEGDDLGTVL
jgi:hypothetical protein